MNNSTMNCEEVVLIDGVLYFNVPIEFILNSSKNSSILDPKIVRIGEKECLIPAESIESISVPNNDYAYRGRKVPIAVLSDKYTPLEETAYDSLEKILIPLPQDGSVVQPNEDAPQPTDAKNITLKEYLAKRWKGKRAKRVRKGIRRGARNSIKYLESATGQMQTMFPDATSLASTIAQQTKQRSH